LAVLACAAVLAAPALALPVPKSVAGYLLGPKMIRAEFFVLTRDGVQHDFRLDRGRLLRRWAKNQLVLVERDGTTTPVKVASSANVLLNGRASNLRALRPGMQIAISRDRDLPADSVWASATKTAPKLPLAVTSFLFGNRLVTAEIAVQSADPHAPHDYLLDRGRIRQVSPNTLTLRKIDGTVLQIPVSSAARVKLDGQDASFAQLRRGMMVTTMHDGDTQPADQIFATRK
jgi:hypothetical protein